MNRRKFLAVWLGAATLPACVSRQREKHDGPETPNRYGGTAVGAFSIPYYEARSAVIGVFHGMAIRLDALQPLESPANGEYIRGTRGDLQVQVSLARRGETATDVRIDAWRAAVFGDTAAAEAILGMLKRRLGLASGHTGPR